MKYTDWMIQKIKAYPLQRAAIESIPKQIKTIESRSRSIRSARADATPISGGTNQREEMLIANLFEIQQLEENLQRAEADVEIMDAAFALLTMAEKEVIESFYINKKPGHVERLMESLGYEKSQIYRIKDDALVKLSKALTGYAEL